MDISEKAFEMMKQFGYESGFRIKLDEHSIRFFDDNPNHTYIFEFFNTCMSFLGFLCNRIENASGNVRINHFIKRVNNYHKSAFYEVGIYEGLLFAKIGISYPSIDELDKNWSKQVFFETTDNLFYLSYFLKKVVAGKLSSESSAKRLQTNYNRRIVALIKGANDYLATHDILDNSWDKVELRVNKVTCKETVCTDFLQSRYLSLDCNTQSRSMNCIDQLIQNKIRMLKRENLVYHHTETENINSILRNGILTKKAYSRDLGYQEKLNKYNRLIDDELHSNLPHREKAIFFTPFLSKVPSIVVDIGAIPSRTKFTAGNQTVGDMVFGFIDRLVEDEEAGRKIAIEAAESAHEYCPGSAKPGDEIEIWTDTDIHPSAIVCAIEDWKEKVISNPYWRLGKQCNDNKLL